MQYIWNSYIGKWLWDTYLYHTKPKLNMSLTELSYVDGLHKATWCKGEYDRGKVRIDRVSWSGLKHLTFTNFTETLDCVSTLLQPLHKAFERLTTDNLTLPSLPFTSSVLITWGPLSSDLLLQHLSHASFAQLLACFNLLLTRQQESSLWNINSTCLSF